MKTIIEVPLSEVSLSGEGGETVAPEEGDLVTVTTPGRVVAVKGDRAQVEVGPDEGEATDAPPPTDGDAAMEKELAGMYEESRQGGM